MKAKEKKQIEALKGAYKTLISKGYYNEALDTAALLVDADKKYYPLIQKIRSDLTAKMQNDPDHYYEILKRSYIVTGRHFFDDYLIAMEWERDPASRFYFPRRKALLNVVKYLQKLADDELDLLCISMPPGTGKSGLANFFMTWLAGRNPKEGMVAASHNADFLTQAYDECLREMVPGGEYLWSAIFPERKIAKTNAKGMKIDIDRAQKFSTFQFKSIKAENAGITRALQLLYCDDLVPGIQVALSPEQLDKLWTTYSVDLKSRKQGDHCKELHIATRWSVHDVIGRLEDVNEGNKRAYFLAVPALDENGESNFDYGGGNGFSTKFYEDLRDTMDDMSWKALYMNQPIEREGLLYKNEELRRFLNLPEEEPDGVFAVCDTAEGGGDFTVMPIFAVYGNDHYMIDCVCSDERPEVTDDLCARALVRNKVKMCQFESNAAGGRTADVIEKKVKELGGRCHITKKRTTQNKETKIYANSPFIKERCLFMDESKIVKKSMYAAFMDMMVSYSLKGKNKHDDVPDALAQYALYTEDGINNRVVIMKRPW